MSLPFPAEDSGIFVHGSTVDNRAVLCGVCKRTLSIREYMQSEKCPWCGSAFNPGCKNHFDIYFEVSPGNQCRKHAPETGA